MFERLTREDWQIFTFTYPDAMRHLRRCALMREAEALLAQESLTDTERRRLDHLNAVLIQTKGDDLGER